MILMTPLPKILFLGGASIAGTLLPASTKPDKLPSDNTDTDAAPFKKATMSYCISVFRHNPYS